MSDTTTTGPPDPVARANARRLDLVEKKYKGGGLTPGEQDELNACARSVGEWAAGTPAPREPPPCSIRTVL